MTKKINLPLCIFQHSKKTVQGVRWRVFSASLRHHPFVELGQAGFQFHRLLVIEAVQSCAPFLLCSFTGSKSHIIKG